MSAAEGSEVIAEAGRREIPGTPRRYHPPRGRFKDARQRRSGRPPRPARV